MTVPWPHGALGGLADAGGHRVGAFAVGRACQHRHTEDAPHRGDIPARSPVWRRALVVGAAFGDAIKAGRCVRVDIPDRDLGDHRGFDRIDLQAPGIARALGVHDIAAGGTLQGSRWPRRHYACRPRRIRSVIRVRSYSATTPRIWSRSGQQAPLKDGQGCPIPQPIQARPMQLGPAIAVIAVDVFLGQMPIGLGRYIRAKPGQLLVNRLRLLWTGGRDTDIQGYFYGTPPAGVMGNVSNIVSRFAHFLRGFVNCGRVVGPMEGHHGRALYPGPCARR
jgi:hypothetical protein